MRALLLGATLAAALTPSATARAETYVLPPPDVEADVDPLHVQATLGRIREWVSQRGDQLVIVPSGQANEAGLPVPCARTSCGEPYFEHFQADALVQVQVFRPREGVGGAQGTLAIAIVRPPRARYQATEPIRAVSGAAADRALADLQVALARGPGPFLEVVGTPEDATVLINGQRVGALPYYGKPGAGELVLEVRKDGYVPHHNTLILKNSAAEYQLLEVHLQRGEVPAAAQELAPPQEPAHAEPPPPVAVAYDPPSRAAPVAGVVVGTLAAASAVPLLVLGAQNLPGSSSCEDPLSDSADCSLWRTSDAKGMPLLVTGAVLLAVGVTTTTVSGLRLSASASPSSAHLFLHGEF